MPEEKTEQLKWRSRDLPGTFYTRGKSRVIWYRYGRHTRISTSLHYTAKNKRNAVERVKAMYQNTNKDKIQIRLSDAIKEFMAIKEKTGSSEVTLYIYKLAFRQMFDNDYYIDNTDMIKKEILKNLDLYSNTNSKITRLKSLNSFFNYLSGTYDINNPVSSIKIKNPQKKIVLFTKDEFEKIFDYIKTKDMKYYVFIDFIYYTAFRISEAINLKHSDMTDKEIKFVSKYRDRYDKFPISSTLNQKIEIIKKYHNSKEFLFDYRTRKAVSIKFSKIVKSLFPYKKNNEKTIHTLRKNRISYWLYEKRLSYQVVSELSRDDINTIMKHYASDDNSKLVQYLDE